MLNVTDPCIRRLLFFFFSFQLKKNYYPLKVATFVSKSHPNPPKTELLTSIAYLSYLFDITI